MNGAQQLANWYGNSNYIIRDVGKFKLFKLGNYGVTPNGLGNFAGAVSLFITGREIIKGGGINWSNGTDLVFGVASMCPGVGWVIGTAYFFSNGIVKELTGKSIGDFLGEAVKNHASQLSGWAPIMPIIY